MGILLSKEVKPLEELGPALPGVRSDWLKAHDALVVTKPRAGFDDESVETITDLLGGIEAGRTPDLKFLIFDFAQGGAEGTHATDGYERMISANADLIVDTPVITIAWARGLMSGLDFDFAMSCSAIVAESGARFSFAGEPFDLFGLYAAIGRRIGFGKAERLIERDATQSSDEARDLMIVRDVVAPQPDLEGVSAYLTQFGRRYNSSHAIFRAQRMAEPPIDRRPFGRAAGDSRAPGPQAALSRRGASLQDSSSGASSSIGRGLLYR
jgi:enoyl-CoA hydratase/carnithine racemase